MERDSLENRMRSLEYFHTLRLLPETWVIIRVDGRSFSRFTLDRFEKPFDSTFHQFMVQTAQALLEQLGGIYAYTESDEISVLFTPDWEFFDRSLEKIVSLSASIASAHFSVAIATPVQFDSRVWLGANPVQVVDYFSWRQADASRCALNGWCYWTLRQAGYTADAATAMLAGQSIAAKNELLFQRGINFNEIPLWQRRGTGLYWETYEKEGFNPVKQQTEVAVRRRIRLDDELPMKETYREFIDRLIKGSLS